MGLILDLSPENIGKECCTLLPISYWITADSGLAVQTGSFRERNIRMHRETYGHIDFRVGMGAESIMELLQSN